MIKIKNLRYHRFIKPVIFLSLFLYALPVSSETHVHSFGAGITVGGTAGGIVGGGGAPSGDTQMAFLEYGYRWRSKLALDIRIAGQESDHGTISESYEWNGYGLEGGVSVFPFRGRMRGFHTSGALGVWYVDWTKEENMGSTMSSLWIQTDSGSSLGLHFYSKTGHRFLFGNHFFIDPTFQVGAFTIFGELSNLYMSIGGSLGSQW